MSEYIPITGKIRERMEQAEHIYPIVDGMQNTQVRINLAWLTERLDEIDSIHAALEADNERLRGEWDFWESTHVELPKDADGEYIHIGDVMENVVCPPVHREVTGVGVECFYGWDEGNGRYSQFSANCYRHHHAPTVEDVLREFAGECLTYATCVEDHEVTDAIERFAAKLRLAGEDE